MPTIAIETELCKKCGSCAMVCPEAVFVQREKATVPEVVHAEQCIGCGQCAAVCPQGAVRHSAFPAGSILPLDPDPPLTPEQVTRLLQARRSMRALKKDKPVERELIETILEAAQLAPSARNEQGTGFLVVQDPALLRGVAELTLQVQASLVSHPLGAVFSRLALAWEGGKDQILHDAPALVVFHADPGDDFPEVNASLALQNATLVGQALGLGSFYAGYVVAACQGDGRIPRLVGVPDGHTVYGALALGYPRLKFKNRMKRSPPQVTWR